MERSEETWKSTRGFRGYNEKKTTIQRSIQQNKINVVIENHYFQKETSLNKYQGRPRTTLPTTLNNDIKLAKEKYPVMKTVMISR